MEILQQINKITLEKSENLEKKLHVFQNLAKSSAFFFFFFFLNIKIYSHKVVIFLNVPGIPAKKPLQNSK